MPESPKPESLKFEPRRRVQHRQFKSHRYLNHAGPSRIIQPQPIPSHPNQNLPNQCLPNQLQQWIEGLGDGIRLWHVESGQLIRSGESATALIRVVLKWNLSRIAAMQGAAEEEDSAIDSDGDSVAVTADVSDF
ncbi:hypothetical protein N7467_010960 [Penicillium canescens]|nr:hypothetical protein N7467_010960 [Penicillium canescens]